MIIKTYMLFVENRECFLTNMEMLENQRLGLFSTGVFGRFYLLLKSVENGIIFTHGERRYESSDLKGFGEPGPDIFRAV